MNNLEEWYRANRRCMILIPQIADGYRTQSYFYASNQFIILIEQLNKIAAFLQEECNSENFRQNAEEFFLLLPFILQTQERQDYVFLADILEGDLQPCLQKLQLELMNSADVAPEIYWESNRRVLLEKNPGLLEALEYTPDQADTYFAVQAINGQMTLQYRKGSEEYYMHSSINPEREAELWAKRHIQKGYELYYVFGMGLGYHVIELLKQAPGSRVIVLELEPYLVKLSFCYQNLESYLKSGRLEVICEPQEMVLLRSLREEKDKMLLVHEPSLVHMQEGEAKLLLENYLMSMNTMLEQKNLLDHNFFRLQKMNLPECSGLEKMFSGKDVVLAAGGPSLDAELEALKKYRNKVAVLAVGTVAKKLVEYNIIPDAVLISDPQNTMYRQIEGMECTIPLLLLSTASADIPYHYAGQIYLVYQEGYAGAEEAAEKNGYRKFQTGGSVTTLALDIALQFRAQRIILLGTDLAYTNRSSHAGGLGRTIAQGVRLRQVEAVGGGMVETAQNLDIYRRWIERRISQVENILIYNTAHGAKIHGTIEMELEQIF